LAIVPRGPRRSNRIPSPGFRRGRSEHIIPGRRGAHAPTSETSRGDPTRPAFRGREGRKVKRVRIGNGCGFWGDNLDAPIRLAEAGRLDSLTLEYPADLPMSILAVQKQKDPTAGFASDFLDVLGRLTPVLKQQPNLKVVTNAGGMNPRGCAERAN